MMFAAMLSDAFRRGDDHSFMQRPVHPSFAQVKTILDRYKYGWTGKKMKEQKYYIVSYALEVSVNGVRCGFVVHFRSSDTFKVCKLA